MAFLEYDLGRFNPDQFYPSPEELRRRLEAHPAKGEILAYLEEAGTLAEILFRWPDRRGGKLPDIGILRHLVAGNIVIQPFDRRLLQSNGYDVRLGESFYVLADPNRPKPGKKTEIRFPYYDKGVTIYNPFDQENVSGVWIGPVKAERAVWLFDEFEAHKQATPADQQSSWEQMVFLRNITPDDQIIIIPPSFMFLCHTQEFIGGRNIISPSISGKSTAGRNLLEVCSDANLGDVGYCSRWTLEIVNKTTFHAIVLVVGEPMATVQFDELTEPPSRQYRGKYQLGETLEQIMANWRPEDMLPHWRRFGNNSY